MTEPTVPQTVPLAPADAVPLKKRNRVLGAIVGAVIGILIGSVFVQLDNSQVRSGEHETTYAVSLFGKVVHTGSYAGRPLADGGYEFEVPWEARAWCLGLTAALGLAGACIGMVLAPVKGGCSGSL